MDKYKLLYTDSRGVRDVADLDITDRIEAIGVSRYTSFDHGTHGGYELNGTYPVIAIEQFNELFGKVLTIVDASFIEGNQKDAFKSLLKNSMSEWYTKNVDYAAKMTEQAVGAQERNKEKAVATTKATTK